MSIPAYTVHGLNIKAIAMLHMIDSGQIEPNEAHSLLETMQQAIEAIAGLGAPIPNMTTTVQPMAGI